MLERIVPVCVEAPAHPTDCFGIGELRLGEADDCQPLMSKGVTRRKAECLVDVRFGFCASAKEILGKADISMSEGQISIQRQSLLAFRDALSCASRKYLHDAQSRVSRSVVRCDDVGHGLVKTLGPEVVA